ncbi:RNA-directed DNA polymerase, eukaryota, reverse transcriptase zinc-binding domain protein [Tanacetum coccineum]
MSSVRQNEKRQIRVPSKFVDSDYGTRNVKSRRNKNKKDLNPNGVVNESLESKNNDQVDEMDGWETDMVDEMDNSVGGKEANSQKDNVEGIKFSYANVVNNSNLDNKLNLIPTKVNDEGIEVVIFDEEIVNEGNPSVSLDKAEPSKLLLRVKLRNLPLEAWSSKGISAVASRLGTPLIMDQITTNMCKLGNGRLGFARVLVDVEAGKGLPKKTEIVYKNKEGVVKGNKSVNVSYDWASPMNELKKKYESAEFILVQHRKKGGKKVNINEVQMEILKGGTCGLIHKQIAIGKPWVIGGDMNVILKTNEHSVGISFVSSEMQEFNDYVNMIEVEDLCSSGLFFTLTKNLKKAREGNDTGVLKKLDRVMVNEEFLKKFDQSREWKKQIDGFQMFQLVKKMRSLKFYLRKLNWQNGNLFEKLEEVRNELKHIQTEIDGDPHNGDPHNKALRDAEGRYQRNRIERVQNVNGGNFKGEEVAYQFVLHFKKFLGQTEIKEALFDIGDNKAPGPDGYSFVFFEKAWKLIGDDFYKAIKETASFTINVNGENCGFFKDGRGLRQGDHMSPHLFTLVMECFTLMMERNVKKNPNFQYPFRCKSMKITHVCSADDLLVLYHGDDESVKVVRDYIDEIRECSGLLPNFNKSIIFFSSVKDEVQEEIMKVLPF